MCACDLPACTVVSVPNGSLLVGNVQTARFILLYLIGGSEFWMFFRRLVSLYTCKLNICPLIIIMFSVDTIALSLCSTLSAHDFSPGAYVGTVV